jgi:hypothetical protein
VAVVGVIEFIGYLVLRSDTEWSLAKQLAVGGGIVALAAGILAALVGTSNVQKRETLHEILSMSLVLIGVLAGLLSIWAGLAAPNQ